jgi:nucleotide-binding universal stress UspA family protein
MTIQSILCIFGGTEEELNAVNTAFILGKSYAAHLRFLHISVDPNSYAAAYGCGDAVAFPSLRDAVEKENGERMQKAKKYIESLASHYQVALESAVLLEHHSSACFAHLTGCPEIIIAKEGRLCDLIVIGRVGKDALYNDAVMPALFDTGHPVMLLPVKKEPSEIEDYKTAVIAWKSSSEMARAITNAMPFLENAEKVFVLTANGDGETYDLTEEAALLAYLHTHNIHAQAIVVAAGSLDAGEALLAKAKELKADLLVMSAYGHTRFREMMLGGVTNYMLENADIPLLLSH